MVSARTPLVVSTRSSSSSTLETSVSRGSRRTRLSSDSSALRYTFDPPAMSAAAASSHRGDQPTARKLASSTTFPAVLRASRSVAGIGSAT
jgi:hypothetical protein